MPLAVAVGQPVIPPAPPSILPTPAPPSDAYLATWYAPDGTVLPLSQPDLGWHSTDAVSGVHGAVSVAIASDPYVYGGSTVRHIQPQSRVMNWALRIDGPGHMAYLTRFRKIARAFTRTRLLGAGVFEIARPDGTVRQIKAYYQDGLDPASGAMSGWLYGDVVITLFCEDGYWYDPTPTVIKRAYAAADGSSFFSPYLHISSATTLGDTVATNDGDAEAYPQWTIVGPATGITATNNLTGESFEVDPSATAWGDLESGDTVTISTKPQQILGPDGQPWTNALNYPTAEFWALQPGDNPITITVAGADVGTSVTMQFNNRYETS